MAVQDKLKRYSYRWYLRDQGNVPDNPYYKHQYNKYCKERGIKPEYGNKSPEHIVDNEEYIPLEKVDEEIVNEVRGKKTKQYIQVSYELIEESIMCKKTTLFYLLCRLMRDRAFYQPEYKKLSHPICEDIYNKGFMVVHIGNHNQYSNKIGMSYHTLKRAIKDLETGRYLFTITHKEELFIILGRHNNGKTRKSFVETPFNTLPFEERNIEELINNEL